MSEGEGQDDDCDQGDAHGHPLRRAQSLAEEEHAECDGDQRVDEVAEGRLDDQALLDGVHVRAPVDRQDNGAGGEQPENARIQARPRRPPTARHREHDGQEHQGPDDAMRHDLDRRDAVEQGEVQRERAPDSIGGEDVEQAGRLL